MVIFCHNIILFIHTIHNTTRNGPSVDQQKYSQIYVKEYVDIICHQHRLLLTGTRCRSWGIFLHISTCWSQTYRYCRIQLTMMGWCVQVTECFRKLLVCWGSVPCQYWYIYIMQMGLNMLSSVMLCIIDLNVKIITVLCWK